MHTNQDDGISYLDSGEHYYVTGYLIMKVHVCFDTRHELGTKGFDEDLDDALYNADFSLGDIIGYDGLDFQVERD